MRTDIPDPTIDWGNIRLTTRSKAIRTKLGWRICTRCGNTLAVNEYNYPRNKRNPDGYDYQCKECHYNKRKKKV